MNKERRKMIANVLDLLYRAKDILEEAKDGEFDAFYNLPEGLQCSERGETMEQNVEVLETAYDTIEEQINELEEIE